ncbi:hypothetical protein EC991_010082 [Linnemannia zychae]|nr:hypothetical protein EC991_010082 [Linnemannia zychae]
MESFQQQHISTQTQPLRQHRPARLSLATHLHPLSELSTRFIGTKPLNSELCTSTTSSADTAMDLGSGVSVLFSVNPPSPAESELCSDDQEAIVRTWCTAGPSTEQLLGREDRARAHVSCATQADSATASPTPMSTATVSSNIDLSGKKGVRGPRRGSSENNKKAELYKTELCISVHSGLVCKYGDNCQFAHSVAELQHVHRHPRYKTQLCTSFQSQGFCKYNDRCTFIHHPEEARVLISPSLFRKTENHQDTNDIPSQDVNSQVSSQVPNQVINHEPNQVSRFIFCQMVNAMSSQNQRWTVPSSVSTPNSGSVSPNQLLADYNKMDRTRSMSDPCIPTYMNGSHSMQIPQALRMDGHRMEQRLYYEAPMTIDMGSQDAQYPQPQVLAIPMSNEPYQFMHQAPQQSEPLSMRRQRRMGICYPAPPGFSVNNGHPVPQRDILDLLPHYNEHGMFDPDLAGRAAGAVRPPWMTPSSIWQPLNNVALCGSTNTNDNTTATQAQGHVQGQGQSLNQSQVVPESFKAGTIESNDDVEWVSKLARYIATPQNDFEI